MKQKMGGTPEKNPKAAHADVLYSAELFSDTNRR